MAFTSLFKKLFTNSHNKLYTLNYLQLDIIIYSIIQNRNSIRLYSMLFLIF